MISDDEEREKDETGIGSQWLYNGNFKASKPVLSLLLMI